MGGCDGDAGTYDFARPPIQQAMRSQTPTRRHLSHPRPSGLLAALVLAALVIPPSQSSG